MQKSDISWSRFKFVKSCSGIGETLMAMENIESAEREMLVVRSASFAKNYYKEFMSMGFAVSPVTSTSCIGTA